MQTDLSRPHASRRATARPLPRPAAPAEADPRRWARPSLPPPELYGRPVRLDRFRLNAGRALGAAAVALGCFYLYWRTTTLAGAGALGVVFYVAELASFALVALSVLAFWRARWRDGPPAGPTGSLDVFITVCGEPAPLVEETLRAALAMDYPHRTYVLNDGRLAGAPGWREIEALARRYGITCLTRTEGRRGKAGNLNHALARTHGEFVAVIDADHVAERGFAVQTLGYFVDPQVAFVCTPQRFRSDDGDPLGNRELFFYRFLQATKDADDCAISCGNATIYRRRALASIGGFSEWNLVEDLHTSYELHARSWKSVYHPWPVTTGLAPETPSAFAKQRVRWATDALRMLLWDNPLVKRGLRPRQRLHYLHTTSFYLVASAQVLFVVSPALWLLWRIPVMRVESGREYVVHAAPYLAAVVAMLMVLGGVRPALRTIQQQTYAAPLYVYALLRAATRVRFPSGVTDKARRRADLRGVCVNAPQAIVGALLLVSIGVAFTRPTQEVLLAVLWAGWGIVALTAPLWAGSRFTRAARFGRGVVRASVVALVAAHLVPSLLPSPPVAGGAAAAAPYLVSGATSEHFRASALPPPPQRKLAPPRAGAYVGAFTPELLRSPTAVTRWQRRHATKLHLVHWYQQWLSGERRFRSDWARMVRRQGAVPLITWEPWRKPANRVHAKRQPPVRLSQIAAGRYDAYVRRWARAAAAYREPILLRPMHEMNGDWYPWAIGQNGNSERDFVRAWRRLHRIFQREGATNVSWVWTVNTFTGLKNDNRRLAEYYPGARYVDWVSATGFNWGDSNNWNVWRDAGEIFRATYAALRGLGKPIMISEIGTVSSGGDAGRWVADALLRVRTEYPAVRAVVWFDAPYSRYVDFSLRGRAAAALRAMSREAAYYRPALRLIETRTPPRRSLTERRASHAPSAR